MIIKVTAIRIVQCMCTINFEFVCRYQVRLEGFKFILYIFLGKKPNDLIANSLGLNMKLLAF